MRVGFNGHRLSGQRLGVGRYIEYMLRYWGEQLAPGEEVELYLRRALEPAARDYLALPPTIRERVLPPDVSGIPWENLALRRQARRTDVLFCPAYTAPVRYPGRVVVATHSVNEIASGAHAWWYPHTYGRLYRHSAEQAEAVIVTSETTREDIARLWDIPRERMVVVLQGADDCFRPMDDPAALAAVRRQFFGGDRPFILFVGKASTRRNIPLLLRAFAQLRREQRIPHGLLLFGPNPDDLPLAELCAELGITGDVVQTEGRIVDHRDLVPIYNAADVFVHPSLYEGWSMTTVEAMACGTAVVAANRGGLGELVAGHALTLDTPTVDSLADAIGRVLTDDALRAELRRKSFARGSAINWREAARQTLDVLRRVAAH